MRLRIASMGLLLIAVGCSAPPEAPPPKASIVVSGATGPLDTGATRTFTATVTSASNPAITWSVVETGGGTITADGVYTAPAIPSTYTVKATLVEDSRVSGSAPVPVVIPVTRTPGYDVGVDYHAYGDDFLHTAFIAVYHHAAVRAQVLAQLQGMADRGATRIFTRLWFVTDPGGDSFGETWRLHFPMTDQERDNLRAYATDVASVIGTGGNPLRLDLCLLWLGSADYMQGSPASGLGTSNLSGTEYLSRAGTSIDQVLAGISGVTRGDGVAAVESVYLDGELMIGAKPNLDWFLSNLEPSFNAKVSAAGFTPTMYFISVPKEADVLDDSYVDVDYPILNGHKSMYWIYRSLKYMADQGLAIPARIDFSNYVQSAGAPDSQLLTRILDDADATLPSLGAPMSYGAAETFYFADPVARHELGQAFAAEAANDGRMMRVNFWTTPDSGVNGEDAGYPFSIEDFYLPAP